MTTRARANRGACWPTASVATFVTRVTPVTNVATLAFGEQPPRFARARVVILPPSSRLTG